ncbi:MAG: hypothetical protein ABI693_16510 [Bryobacteraceae bacterium]
MNRGVVRFLLLVFFVALAIRVALLLLAPGFGQLPPMEMERVARSLAAGRGLANPFATPTGPTAHLLPLYPMVLGVIYKIWGTGSTGILVQGLFSCTLASLRCALLFPLARLMSLDSRTAGLASLLSVFYIPAFATEIRGGWDAPLTALFLMGLAWLAILIARRPILSLRSAIGSGFLVGLSTLLSAVLLASSLGFMAAGALVFRRRLRAYLTWCIVCGAVVLLCLTPWALRNRQQMGKTIWLRSNFGFELWQAYHEGAGVGALDTSALLGPAVNVEISNRVAVIGEVEFQASMERDALRWIQAHPIKAGQLFLAHGIYFWFPPGQWLPLRLVRALLTVLAWAGLWILLARKSPAGYILAVIWIVFPLIYYVVYWSSRYRYPMEWTLLLAAAVVPCALWSRYTRSKEAGAQLRPPVSRSR